MDPITSRNRSRPADPDVYWRRRLFALAAGLAVLGLLAWAVGGASAARPAASTTSVSGRTPPSTPTVAPTPTVTSVSPSPSPTSPSPSPSPSASTSRPASTQAAKPKPRSHRAAAGLNAPGDDCPPGDVVVSLTGNGDSFGGTARPEFTVDVVSTARRACAFNVGARYLTVVIESGGVRAWGSADCVRGTGSQVAMLGRGVPVQRHITWDRTLSAPGCRLPRTAARPGTYTVTASGSGLHSHTLVFLLR